MSLSTYEQLRMCHVRRWHIVQVKREQTVAEHSYAVAVIAGSLAASMKWPGLLHDGHRLRLLQWSLAHDMMEVKTGDTPTPFKRALEAAGGEGIVEKAEEHMDRDATSAYRLVKGTEIEMIVKLADQIEAIFFLQDNGYGQHAIEVLDELRAILSQMTNDFAERHPTLLVRDAVRKVCAETNIHGGWL